MSTLRTWTNYTVVSSEDSTFGTDTKISASDSLSDINSTISNYIPPFSIINSVEIGCTAYQTIALGSTKADMEIGFGNGSEGNVGQYIVNGDKNVPKGVDTVISGDATSCFVREGANAGKFIDSITSQYGYLHWYLHCSVTRTLKFWNRYIDFDYTPPKYTFNVTVEGEGTVTGDGTHDIKRCEQTESGGTNWNPVPLEFKLTATPNTGWRFVKWVDNAGNDYMGVTLTKKVSVWELTAHETTENYTAVFERIPYTINYRANGSGYINGISYSGTMEAQTATVTNDVTLAKNTFRQYRTITLDPNCSDLDKQYVYSFSEFKGWEDHGSITADNGTEFSYTQFDAPYYANTYPDLYNAFGYNKLSLVNHWVNNGQNEGRQCVGEERGLYPDEAVVNSLDNPGSTTDLYAAWGDFQPAELPDYVERSQYIFDGWYTSPTDGEKVEGEYLPDRNVTLYAHWRDGYWSLCDLLNSTKKPLRIFIDEQEVKKIFIDEKKKYASFAAKQGSVADIEVVKKQTGTNKEIRIPLYDFCDPPESCSLTLNDEVFSRENGFGGHSATADYVSFVYPAQRYHHETKALTELGDGDMVLTVSHDGKTYIEKFRVKNIDDCCENKVFWKRAIVGEKYTFSLFEYSYTKLDYGNNSNYVEIPDISASSNSRTSDEVSNIRREVCDNYDIISYDFIPAEYEYNVAQVYYYPLKEPNTYNKADFGWIKTGDYKCAIGYEYLDTIYTFDVGSTTDLKFNSNNIDGETYAIIKIRLQAIEDTTITVSYSQLTQSSYNYGFFSNLDTEFTCDASAEKSYKRGIFYNYKSNKTITGTVTYDVPVGEHFFFVKYVKGSTEYEKDSLSFSFDGY